MEASTRGGGGGGSRGYTRVQGRCRAGLGALGRGGGDGWIGRFNRLGTVGSAHEEDRIRIIPREEDRRNCEGRFT